LIIRCHVWHRFLTPCLASKSCQTSCMQSTLSNFYKRALSIPSIAPALLPPLQVSGVLLIPSNTPVTTRAVKPILSTDTFYSHKSSGKSSALRISATFLTALRPTEVSGVLIPLNTPVTSIANEASVSSNTLVSVLIDTEVFISIDTTWGSGFLITLIGGPKV